MGNQFGRDQNRFQRQDRDWDRDDNRNLWHSRDDRDEDGGWGRHRPDEGWRNRGMDRDDERRFGESSGAGGQGQRGYGRAINAGYDQDPSGSYGATAGYGGYHGLGGGYAVHGEGSRGYSPTGLGRDRFGSQRDQGFRSRDFGGGGFAGRGPKDYKRTDERVREDVCDRLSQDDEVDASDISVRVENGEVTLEGTTETRRQKHRAEEIAADVSGVSDVHNHVRVRKSMLSELKDKVTGDDEPTGGHAGSGTRDTSNLSSRQSH